MTEIQMVMSASILIGHDKDNRWFIEISAGTKSDTWGPYADKFNAIILAGEAAKHLQKLAADQ